MKTVLPALLALSVASAHAASYTVSEGFGYPESDLATSSFDNYLPTFNSAKGALQFVEVRYVADLTWSQELFEPVDPSKPWVLGASAEVSGSANSGAGFSYSSPNVFQRESGPVPVFPVFHVTGQFVDDPSYYLDPSSPEDLVIVALPGAFCVSNCQVLFLEDTFGTLNGTIRTTFNYRPSTIPEPASLALLAVGLIGAVGVLSLARPRS